MTDFTAHGPKNPNPRVANDRARGLLPEPPSHMLPAWPSPTPLPPPPHVAGDEPAQQPTSPVAESRALTEKRRLVRERAFPWYVRLFRWLAQVNTTTYEFADAMDLRLTEIQRVLRQSSSGEQDLITSFNDQATALNRLRSQYAHLIHRVVYYEEHVPQLRRAKEEYDRAELWRQAARAAEAGLEQPDILPIGFDRNGVNRRDT
jgi:hypothetical protein